MWKFPSGKVVYYTYIVILQLLIRKYADTPQILAGVDSSFWEEVSEELNLKKDKME